MHSPSGDEGLIIELAVSFSGLASTWPIGQALIVAPTVQPIHWAGYTKFQQPYSIFIEPVQ